jgi:hypothetical protein
LDVAASGEGTMVEVVIFPDILTSGVDRIFRSTYHAGEVTSSRIRHV